MFRSPLYMLYSMLVLGGVGVAEWRGMGLTKINELKNVPRTIRDNPGAYRSHYGYYGGRYIGGK